MRQVDKNNAIKPVSASVRADACHYEAAAAAGGRKDDRLYFPVNLDDEAVLAATEPPAAGDAPERGACIFLLISETRPPLPAAQRSRSNISGAGCLYFPVNSADEPRGAAARTLAQHR